MILGGELKMTTNRVDESREEVADYTDRKLKELRKEVADYTDRKLKELQTHFAGEVEELKREFRGKLQVLEQRKYPETKLIILVTVLVGLALCLGVAATIAFNVVAAQNELRREFELLKTKQEQTEGTNEQVGYLMGQLNSMLTVKEGAAAVLVFTAVIAIGVVLLCLFFQNNLVVSMPLKNSKTTVRMIEQ